MRLKKGFAQILISVMLAIGTAHAAENVCSIDMNGHSGQSKLPSAITRLIPQGYVMLDCMGGQLTDARRLDYLVVIHHPVDTVKQPSPRPLLIFT